MKDVDDRTEALNKLTDIITEPAARVETCGQMAEDPSTIYNFEQISEGQDLFSANQLIQAYQKGKQEVQSE